MATQPTRFAFVGDISLSHLTPSKLPQPTKHYDFFGGNLEAPLSGTPRHDKIGPIHCTTLSNLSSLKRYGLTYLSLANNHISDQGERGIINTKQALSKLGILHSGSGDLSDFASAVTVMRVSHLRVACVAVADNDTSGPPRLDHVGYYFSDDPRLESELKSLRLTCDLIILFSHGGLEEVSLPPQSRIAQLRKYIDWGVDLVIGAHPHVVQGYEKYRGGYIFYSLGDYLFESSSSNDDPSFGALLEFNYSTLGLSEPIITYIKNGQQSRLKNILLKSYLNLSSRLLRSKYISELILFQNRSLYKDRYYNFFRSFLLKTIDFHLSPFHLRFNTRFLRLLRLLFYNSSHREVLFSPFRWLTWSPKLAPALRRYYQLKKYLTELS